MKKWGPGQQFSFSFLWGRPYHRNNRNIKELTGRPQLKRKKKICCALFSFKSFLPNPGLCDLCARIWQRKDKEKSFFLYTSWTAPRLFLLFYMWAVLKWKKKGKRETRSVLASGKPPMASSRFHCSSPCLAQSPHCVWMGGQWTKEQLTVHSHLYIGAKRT